MCDGEKSVGFKQVKINVLFLYTCSISLGKCNFTSQYYLVAVVNYPASFVILRVCTTVFSC